VASKQLLSTDDEWPFGPEERVELVDRAIARLPAPGPAVLEFMERVAQYAASGVRRSAGPFHSVPEAVKAFGGTPALRALESPGKVTMATGCPECGAPPGLPCALPSGKLRVCHSARTYKWREERELGHANFQGRPDTYNSRLAKQGLRVEKVLGAWTLTLVPPPESAAVYAERATPDLREPPKGAGFPPRSAEVCPCPSCGAQKGESCRSPAGRHHDDYTHRARLTESDRLRTFDEWRAAGFFVVRGQRHRDRDERGPLFSREQVRARRPRPAEEDGLDWGLDDDHSFGSD
jgi:hypothetical protein